MHLVICESGALVNLHQQEQIVLFLLHIEILIHPVKILLKDDQLILVFMAI